MVYLGLYYYSNVIIIANWFTHGAPGVHKRSFEMPGHSKIELEFGNVGFWGEGKTWVLGEKPLGAE